MEIIHSCCTRRTAFFRTLRQTHLTPQSSRSRKLPASALSRNANKISLHVFYKVKTVTTIPYSSWFLFPRSATRIQSRPISIAIAACALPLGCASLSMASLFKWRLTKLDASLHFCGLGKPNAIYTSACCASLSIAAVLSSYSSPLPTVWSTLTANGRYSTTAGSSTSN